jgi:transcriptional regulator with XRE-family HTH domain
MAHPQQRVPVGDRPATGLGQTPECVVAADFDIKALHAALDSERKAKSLTWAALAKEIEGPEPGGISPSTLSGMAKREALNGNVVMGALRWLDRTPESFIAGHPDAQTRPPLPRDLPQRFFRRWDLIALHQALDSRREERQLTWAEAAREIGVTTAQLAGYAKADRFVNFPAVMRVTRWLGRPLTDFILRDQGPTSR